MKKTIGALVFTLSIVATLSANAQQQRRKGKPAEPAKSAAPATLSAETGFSENEITARLGFVATAVHLGASFNKMSEGTGWGGYFFFQTEKASAGVGQLMSFGGNLKVNFFENRNVVFYGAPGFGLHMVKFTGAGSSNETLIGPSLQLGFQYRIKEDLSVGLERGSVSNWFNDKIGSSEAAFYSATATMNF